MVRGCPRPGPLDSLLRRSRGGSGWRPYVPDRAHTSRWGGLDGPGGTRSGAARRPVIDPATLGRQRQDRGRRRVPGGGDRVRSAGADGRRCGTGSSSNRGSQGWTTRSSRRTTGTTRCSRRDPQVFASGAGVAVGVVDLRRLAASNAQPLCRSWSDRACKEGRIFTRLGLDLGEELRSRGRPVRLGRPNARRRMGADCPLSPRREHRRG